MDNVVKIILFFVIAAVGLYVAPLLTVLAIMAGVFPELPETGVAGFKLWFGGGSMWVWIAAIFTAVGSLSTKNTNRKYALMFAPVYAPAIFAVGVLMYFNFV